MRKLGTNQAMGSGRRCQEGNNILARVGADNFMCQSRVRNWSTDMFADHCTKSAF